MAKEEALPEAMSLDSGEFAEAAFGDSLKMGGRILIVTKVRERINNHGDLLIYM